MCFSATASFGASVVLIPVGLYCLKKAAGLKQPYWVFALLPLVFGVQQIFEGFVWLGLEADDGASVRLPALGFMLFSHVFWLFWIPFACYALETDATRKKLFYGLIFVGAALGLSMYIPLWLHHDWLRVLITEHSIDYKTTLVYDAYVPRIALRVFYAVIVLTPLLLASERSIKIFGLIIAVSVAFSSIYYGYAFISVWCYFAAVLSLYILFMILRKSRVGLIQ